MKTLKTVFGEIVGLFVDDGSFALAILFWIGIVWLLISRFRGAIPGYALLLAGLIVVLVESLLRFARRAAKNAQPS